MTQLLEAIARRHLRELREEEQQILRALSSHQNSLLPGLKLQQRLSKVRSKIEIAEKELSHDR